MSENIQTFEQLQREIEESTRLFKEKVEKNPRADTFAKIQQNLQSNNFFLNNERKDFFDKIEREKDTYSYKVITENKAKAREQFDKLATSLVEEAKAEVMELYNNKRGYIRSMLSKAPTEEQIRLLNGLRMRQEVDEFEIVAIMGTFFDNYQAMRVLQDIAKASGHSVKFPVQLDCKILYEELDKAKDYLIRACDELPKPYKDIDLTYHAFFFKGGDTPNHDPQYETYIKLFDSYPQLNEVEVTKTGLSPTERVRVDHYMSKVEELYKKEPDSIKTLKAVAEAMDAHPEAVSLFKLSEYGALVNEVEQARTEEQTGAGE